MADISTTLDNIKAHWSLEETSGTRVDQTGTYNLTDNNTVGFDASGKIANCADFIAANSESLSRSSEAVWGYNSGGGSDNTALSISFWFKADSVSGVQGLVGYYTGAQQNDEWLVYLNGTSLILLVRNQGAAVTWGSAISTGTWYHVVATMSSSNTYQLIVNDGTPTTGSGASGTGNTNIQFRVGAYGTTATGFFDGRVDEVTITTDVITSGEVTTIYNGGSGIPYSAGSSGPANLKSYNTNVLANIKSINTNLIANVKSLDTNV